MSSLEAITRGVPLVGIPVFADQSKNVARALMGGYGLLINFSNITTESLNWAIQEATETPKYGLLFKWLKLFVVACKSSQITGRL
jgi:UDP:flavonoid glycosyltransferase YjiC (YdhE family)